MGKSCAFRVMVTLALVTGFTAAGTAMTAGAVTECVITDPACVVDSEDIPGLPEDPIPSIPVPDPEPSQAPEPTEPPVEEPTPAPQPAPAPSPSAAPAPPAAPSGGGGAGGASGSTGGGAPATGAAPAPGGAPGGGAPAAGAPSSSTTQSSSAAPSSGSSPSSSSSPTSGSEAAGTAAPAVPLAPQGPVLTQVEVKAAEAALEEARETLPTSVEPNTRLLAGNTSSNGALIPSPGDTGLLALIVAMAVASTGCAVAAGVLRKRSRPRHAARA